jgi:hypothetical protein
VAKRRAEEDLQHLAARVRHEREVEEQKLAVRRAAQRDAALRELMAFVQTRKLNLDHVVGGAEAAARLSSQSQSQMQSQPRFDAAAMKDERFFFGPAQEAAASAASPRVGAALAATPMTQFAAPSPRPKPQLKLSHVQLQVKHEPGALRRD